MSIEPVITALIDQLAHTPVASDVCNQYADDGELGQATRRANLALYLQRVLACGPNLVLVGEAPGYLGCRRTGVPFTSDRLLLADGGSHGLFGVSNGFRQASDDGHSPGEQTATLVWRELARHGVLALGWNAWPFHPHRAGQPASNRAPRAGELRAGLPFLQTVLALAPDIPIVAMGNSAARSLQALGVSFTKVRHPAQGGARQFADGLAHVVAGLMQRSTQTGTMAANDQRSSSQVRPD